MEKKTKSSDFKATKPPVLDLQNIIVRSGQVGPNSVRIVFDHNTGTVEVSR